MSSPTLLRVSATHWGGGDGATKSYDALHVGEPRLVRVVRGAR